MKFSAKKNFFFESCSFGGENDFHSYGIFWFFFLGFFFGFFFFGFLSGFEFESRSGSWFMGFLGSWCWFFRFFAQKRIRVGPLASLALGLVVLSDYLRKIAFFFRILVFFFPFFEYFSVFWSFGAFFHGQAAFYYEKRPVLAILSAFGIFRCWRHRKTWKKTVFSRFIRFRYFQVLAAS